MERLYKNNFLIKVVAIILMIVDHLGEIFFPHILLLRIIGRLSFPLFGYLVSEGFDRTHNKTVYLSRLLSFFIISQVPYIVAFHNNELNIFATLLFSLIIIWVTENKTLDTFKKALFTTLLLFVGFILPLDYGIAGIISILFFHFFKHSYWKIFVSQLLLWTTYVGMLYINGHLGGKPFQYPNDIIQVFALFSIAIIWFIHKAYPKNDYWNISKMKKQFIQYGFYIFYPLHLLLLYWVALLIK